MSIPEDNGRLKYLMSIDVLFDTRLGTIAMLDRELANRTVTNPEYYTRKTETQRSASKLYTPLDYDSAYTMRDVTTLKNSLVTKITDHLYEDVLEQLKEPTTRLKIASRELHLNIYPYQLSQEAQDALIQGLTEIVPFFNVYHICNYNNLELSPDMIKAKDFTFVYHYDFQGWMNSNMTRLTQCRLPRVYLIFPDLQNREIPRTADRDMIALSKLITPNKAFEIYAMENMLASFRFEPMEYFCINKALLNPRDKKHKRHKGKG